MRGNAWDIVPTHALQNVDVGDVLLTYEGPGHAAEVTGFEGEMLYQGYIAPQFIWVIENWNGVVRNRKIAWDSEIIRGVYRPQYYPQNVF